MLIVHVPIVFSIDSIPFNIKFLFISWTVKIYRNITYLLPTIGKEIKIIFYILPHIIDY